MMDITTATAAAAEQPFLSRDLSGPHDPVRTRRNFLLGLWAAGELRMDDDDAVRYAAELVRFGRRARSDDAVVDIVRADIAAYNGDIGEMIIRRRLHRFEQEATRVVVAGGPDGPPSLAA